MSTRQAKRKITVSMDVSLKVHDTNTSTNQNTTRDRSNRKRREHLKTVYTQSDSDQSEDEREVRCQPKHRRKTDGKGAKMMGHQATTFTKKQERQLMRPWLVEQVERGDIPGLEWFNNDKQLIKIPWTHASRHGWDETRDSDLFRRWAKHTGKYSSEPKERSEDGNPKKWKANFRCAMNSLPDIREEKGFSQKKGTDAFKVYRLLDEKPRGQFRRKPRQYSESSDSDQQYRKYVTKADRLERHNTNIKDKIRQKIIQNKQMKSEDMRPVVRQNLFVKPPIPVTVDSKLHQQFGGSRYQNYTSSDSEEHVAYRQYGTQQLKPRYTMTQSVEQEIEVSTTIEPEGYKYEHSYAVDMRADHPIPSLVADFETEPDSDYGSTSPTSSPECQEEVKIAQNPLLCTPQAFYAQTSISRVMAGVYKYISDMENDYGDGSDYQNSSGLNNSHSSRMFSGTNPNMDHMTIEPMFCTAYSPVMPADPCNSIYKRSESMELYSVPGSSFDQSFPMTGNMAPGTPGITDLNNEAYLDRSLQFSEY